MTNKIRGFSLTELMIVVAVIGILAAVAIPNYQQYILRGKQGAAKAVLLDIAQKQPQFLADRRSTYADCLSATYPAADPALCAGPPANHLSITPPADVLALYTFSITLRASPPGYTAIATPIPAKAGEVGTTSFHITEAGKKLTGVNGTVGTTTW